MTREALRLIGTGAVALLAACSRAPRPQPTAPTAADSTRVRQVADSLAAAARRDSALALARRDSLARADSLARLALERSRADSVRAQVARGDGETAAPATASGLDAASNATLFAPIHFDLDRADLTPAATGLLDAKLPILRANPRLELRIEGHCDDRGPDEYNLALGSRRAAAVKRYLVEHGIAEARIAIVSFGEERPVDPAATEEAWAKNRRAEFAVTRPAR